ncbi:MAG: hypothetical protein M1820_009670 [Bogoriella megaspora]|nr:MAG: hypothetical protein M1820_009670 [Bogoriella megaspora]
MTARFGIPETPSNASSEESPIGKSADSLIAELEAFLGATMTDLFSVEVRYRHPMLPASNKVWLQKTCSIRRTSAECDWSLPEAVFGDPRNNAFEESVRNPAHYSPRHDHLHRDVKIEASETHSPEKEHGARRPTLDCKAQLHHSTETCAATNRSFVPNSRPNSASESLERISAEDTYFTPNATPTRSETPSSFDRMRAQTADSNDKARKIWQSMRRESRSWSREDTRCHENLSPQSLDARLKDIKRNAVRNKRSLGASTLRSMMNEFDGFN